MKTISHHIIDIVHNSIRALSSVISVQVVESVTKNILRIEVEDNGCGMDEKLLSGVTDPFTTTRTTRKIGMGIPLLKFHAEQTNGSFSIESQIGLGTKLIASFQLDHIDLQPLGDLSGAISQLMASTQNSNISFSYHNDKIDFTISSQDIWDILESRVIDSKEMIMIKEIIESNINP
ncbi:MAG: sensor histidine kinase [Candidatus Delongbacteria bacterium]|nr:sensor histidine kinase [Candidatus Delongbacteria bacterium]MBN2834949.1 sensor histidine kinase [Candidatus Delongbacteria bacterium]